MNRNIIIFLRGFFNISISIFAVFFLISGIITDNDLRIISSMFLLAFQFNMNLREAT